MSLSAARHQALLQLLRTDRALSTRELAERLDVSEATIRRDLALLARRGLIQRAHGGALAPEGEPPYTLKLAQNQEVKLAIAQAAQGLVPQGATVILDSGTTLLALAQLLAGRPLRVIALDLPIAQALSVGETEVLLVGGRVRNGFYSLVGSWAEELLLRVRADLFFLGADACDEGGITNYTFEEVGIKRKAISVSARTVLLADRSKWGRRAPAFVAAWKEVDLMITDLERGPEGVALEVVRGAL
jgi:DeoR/GlpR family transcriptional regulator of sugar metabolism